MKKIIELEERWKSYKYRSFIFYVFIFVFIVFLVFVGLFVKNQYSRYSYVGDKQTKNIASKENSNNAVKNADIKNVVDSDVVNNAAGSISNDTITTDTQTNIALVSSESENTYPSISFVCKKIIVDKLMVRKEPSIKSKAVGYYARDGIFCADDRSVNGFLQTNNGWISASNNFSNIVEVNMFVDSGFYDYQSSSQNSSGVLAQAPMEEIKVLNDRPAESKPTRYPSANEAVSDIRNTTNMAQNIQSTNARPLINISSEKITKEREIELKVIDFKNTNSYDIAIEIAEYYFGIKDYQNSIKWALNASEADSKGKAKSQSFIIYAKSLYASGKQEQAIEVLNRYIAKTNSRDAIEALKNIRQGIISG